MTDIFRNIAYVAIIISTVIQVVMFIQLLREEKEFKELNDDD